VDISVHIWKYGTRCETIGIMPGERDPPSMLIFLTVKIKSSF